MDSGMSEVRVLLLEEDWAHIRAGAVIRGLDLPAPDSLEDHQSVGGADIVELLYFHTYWESEAPAQSYLRSAIEETYKRALDFAFFLLPVNGADKPVLLTKGRLSLSYWIESDPEIHFLERDQNGY